jgi:hypothetical protein
MKRLLLILSIATGLTIAGCSSDESGHSHGEDTHTHDTEQQAAGEMDGTHQHENGEEHTHAEEEEGHSHSGEEVHNHEGEESHSHEGEEGNTQLGLDDTYSDLRKGVRLSLSYNSESSSFSGTVENTTEDALPQVRVSVQLSNGTVLGPTDPVDLGAGESQTINLDASGQTFDSWTALSEMGSGGHSHGEDADHEH